MDYIKCIFYFLLIKKLKYTNEALRWGGLCINVRPKYTNEALYWGGLCIDGRQEYTNEALREVICVFAACADIRQESFRALFGYFPQFPQRKRCLIYFAARSNDFMTWHKVQRALSELMFHYKRRHRRCSAFRDVPGQKRQPLTDRRSFCEVL